MLDTHFCTVKVLVYRNNKLVLSAWCAYIQVLPTISLYALIKRHALKIGSHLTIQSIVNNNQNALPLSPPSLPYSYLGDNDITSISSSSFSKLHKLTYL